MERTCIAAVNGSGRCKNPALGGDRDGLCRQHALIRNSGKRVEIAPLPGKILVKFDIGPKIPENIKEIGIATKEISPEKAGNISLGVDSKIPVFGNDGLKNVFIGEVVKELFDYHLVDIHIYEKKANETKVLVLTFSLDVLQDDCQSYGIPVEFEEFLFANWTYAHVWVGSSSNGTVVHTIDLAHKNDKEAEKNLQFADGLWTTE